MAQSAVVVSVVEAELVESAGVAVSAAAPVVPAVSVAEVEIVEVIVQITKHHVAT